MSSHIVSDETLLVGALTGVIPDNVIPIVNFDKQAYATRLVEYLKSFLTNESEIVSLTTLTLLITTRRDYRSIQNTPAVLTLAVCYAIESFLDESTCPWKSTLSRANLFSIREKLFEEVKDSKDEGLAEMSLDAEVLDAEDIARQSFELPKQKGEIPENAKPVYDEDVDAYIPHLPHS